MQVFAQDYQLGTIEDPFSCHITFPFTRETHISHISTSKTGLVKEALAFSEPMATLL